MGKKKERKQHPFSIGQTIDQVKHAAERSGREIVEDPEEVRREGGEPPFWKAVLAYHDVRLTLQMGLPPASYRGKDRGPRLRVVEIEVLAPPPGTEEVTNGS